MWLPSTYIYYSLPIFVYGAYLLYTFSPLIMSLMSLVEQHVDAMILCG